jgi:tetratricopeptide (TPR) repeat protein/predicted Ser/Thr protein kinase
VVSRQVVSHYEILTPLGKGGMGEVYVGLDTTLQRKVAVKALRTDQRLDAVARARLLREARILSQLDHPNICRVYDFVEEGDRDFLILELIEGQSLREALRGGVAPAFNLAIAGQIAAALAAAHGAGVVHRDLKPENVMLLPDHTVKVLDFGLARSFEGPAPAPEGRAAAMWAAAPLLDTVAPAHTIAETLVTMDGALVGTPMYMSPEQVEGASATTASDMYAFGLLLQELYMREPPFPPGSDVHAVLTRILTGNVPAPVGLGRDLTDLITRLKALAPAQRPTALDTVERLSAIREKPRQRLQYAAAALLVLAAVGGGIKYAVDVTRERTAALAAREEATQRRGQAEALIGFMLGDLRGKLQRVGRLDILDDVGQRAMAYFAAVPEASISNEELFRRSQAVHQIGQVRQARGDMKGAAAAYDESLKLVQSLAGRDPSNGEWQIGLATSHFYAGDILRLQSDFDGAMRHYSAYRDIAKALVDREPANPTYLLELSYGHSNVAAALQAKGDFEGARRELDVSLALKEQLAARDPADAESAEAVANGHNRLGIVLERLGEPALALEHYQQDLDIGEGLLQKSPNDTQRLRQVSDAASYVGGIHRDTGDLPLAASHFARVLRMKQELFELDPTNIVSRRDLAMASHLQATLLVERGQYRDAIRLLQTADAMIRPLRERNDQFARDSALVDVALGTAYLAAGEVESARAHALAAVTPLRALKEKSPADRETRMALARAYLVDADASVQRGETQRASLSWQGAYEALSEIAPASKEHRLRAVWARTLMSLGRVDDAAPIVNDLQRAGFRNRALQESWQRAQTARRQ